MSELIRMNNISKIYNKGKSNEVVALDSVDFTLERGESLAVMGVSGSGKSTLLNVIGCMDNMTSGEYYFDGKEVHNMNDNEIARLRGDKIGFVLQSYGLLPSESVMTNVEMPLYFMKGSNMKDAKRRVYATLESLGIAELAKRKVKTLSGGQRQRVAIARAIIKDPDIILADEPTGALDSETAKNTMELFSEIAKSGKSVIMVTHDVNMAKYMNRTVYIKDGKISNQ